MFFVRRPSPQAIDRLRAAQRDRPFSYPFVGITREDDGTAPDDVAPGAAGNGVRRAALRHAAPVGLGLAAYMAAGAALDRWAMYDLDWLSHCWPTVPTTPGNTVAVLVRHPGLWSLHVARVVYAFDVDDGTVARRGFALGTLPAHGEAGEERFSVTYDRRDGAVTFGIVTYARPRHPLVRLAASRLGALQRRFARDATAAVRRHVARALA